ncbi:MAG: hypothetical protein R3C31_01100 [Hyphomonadaceae bacterium]
MSAPTGYMLSAAEGIITVTLCGGGTAPFDFGKSRDGQHKDGKAAPCLFAAAAHAASPPNAPAVLALGVSLLVQTAIIEPTRAAERMAAPPPPSTGPPLNA